MALNREWLGKTIEGEPASIEAEFASAYALATDDPRDTFVGDGAEWAPPMFAVRPMMAIVLGVLREPELGADLRMLLHGEQRMRFHRMLRVGEEVTASVTVSHMERKRSGEVLELEQRLVDASGEPIVEASGVMFIRDAAVSEKAAPAPAPERGEPAYREVQRVAEDQADRYAWASGDGNPIHVDDAFAKAAGLPGVILHGLCTMAFSVRAIVDGVCGGDPERLERVGVRFARPVRPGDSVETLVWPDGEGSWAFEARNQRGEVVLAMGSATTRS